MNQSHADVSRTPEINEAGLSGFGDDRLDAPSVTPVPAPPDDQLVRLAGAGAIAAAVVALAVAWWVRRNVKISWR